MTAAWSACRRWQEGREDTIEHFLFTALAQTRLVVDRASSNYSRYRATAQSMLRAPAGATADPLATAPLPLPLVSTPAALAPVHSQLRSDRQGGLRTRQRGRPDSPLLCCRW